MGKEESNISIEGYKRFGKSRQGSSERRGGSRIFAKGGPASGLELINLRM